MMLRRIVPIHITSSIRRCKRFVTTLQYCAIDIDTVATPSFFFVSVWSSDILFPFLARVTPPRHEWFSSYFLSGSSTASHVSSFTFFCCLVVFVDKLSNLYQEKNREHNVHPW